MNIEIGLLLVACVLWAIGFFLLRPHRSIGGSDSSNGRSAAGTVSIIIPARNEEGNLPVLLRSLSSQSTKPREIIVVNDGSTDRTVEVAREYGATVISSKPLPEGWRGKTWACHQGAQSANGALLLFVDADTWFEPDGLNRILSHYEGGAFSVGPYHAVRNAYEDLSLFFNLNMIVGTVPDRLFGQMLLVDRDSFARVGGHEAVKGRILENYFLARQFHDSNIAVRSAIGRGVLSFRMYPNGLRELMDGWTKGFAAGAAQTPGRVLLLVVAWMTGLTLVPIGGLAAANGFWWGIAYLLCAGQVMWLSRLIGSFKWFTAFLYPLPLLFFFAVFTRSSLRSGKQVTWKGREIRAD